MEKLIKEEIINRTNNKYLHLVYIKDKDKNYLDIYNIVDDKVYYITRIDTAYFYSGITYKVNSNYFMLYQYRPIIGSKLSYITNIFNYYDLDENINIIDTIKNLVLKFNDNTLLYDPIYFNNNCYPYGMIKREKRKKLLNTNSLKDFNLYLTELRANTNGIETIKQENSKIINLSDYFDDSEKVLSLGGLPND